MRPITSVSLIGLLLLVPYSALRAADKENPSTLDIEVTLRDGSHIKGEIVPNRPLEVISPVVGKVSVALSRIDTITFGDDPKQAALRLSNGDTLQGALTIQAVNMTALFGPIKIPLSDLKKLQLHSRDAGGSRLSLEDWTAMPFPEDSDWPSDRGMRATFENGVITLRGQSVRTTRTCTTPVTIECDVVLEDQRVSSDAGFFVRFLLLDPSRANSQTGQVFCGLSFTPRSSEGMRCTPDVGSQAGSGRARDLWKGNSFPFEISKPYHLKLRATPSDLTFSIDETEYRIPNVGVPHQEFLLELWGWQPTSVWKVSRLRVY
jgi:hypothetical protein